MNIPLTYDEALSALRYVKNIYQYHDILRSIKDTSYGHKIIGLEPLDISVLSLNDNLLLGLLVRIEDTLRYEMEGLYKDVKYISLSPIQKLRVLMNEVAFLEAAPNSDLGDPYSTTDFLIKASRIEAGIKKSVAEVLYLLNSDGMYVFPIINILPEFEKAIRILNTRLIDTTNIIIVKLYENDSFPYEGTEDDNLLSSINDLLENTNDIISTHKDKKHIKKDFEF